jgi:hypothetical protein
VAAKLSDSTSCACDGEDSSANLHEAIRDLITVADKRGVQRRLSEKLIGFATGDVDIIEIGQTPLRLILSDGTRPQFRIHPQGMEVDCDTGLIYLTTVEIIEERDKSRRYWGKGKAHLFECNIEGETLRSAILRSDDEQEYHPSGMVLIDGTMFLALSVYGPETSATIIRFNVRDWTYEKLFRIRDHIGLVVPNLNKGEILLGNWGSRHYYCADLNGNIKSKRSTPCSDGLEHQDAQLVSADANILAGMNSSKGSTKDRNVSSDSEETIMLATGITGGRKGYFGLDIFDVTNWKMHASQRWPSSRYTMEGGWPPFVNSTFLWVDSYDRVLALTTEEQASKDPRLVLYALVQRGQADHAKWTDAISL